MWHKNGNQYFTHYYMDVHNFSQFIINNRVKYCTLDVTQNSNQYFTHHYMDLHDFLREPKI